MVRQNTTIVSVASIMQELLRHYTKADIAKFCDVTWMTVFHWSRGTFNPSGSSLKKLVEMRDGYKPEKPEGKSRLQKTKEPAKGSVQSGNTR